MIPANALPLAALALMLWIEAGWVNLLMIRASHPGDPNFAILDTASLARAALLVFWFAFWPAIMLAGVFMAWRARP